MARGGIVATLFDGISCAGSCLGVRLARLHRTVRFQHPVPVDKPLQWEAHVTSTAHPRYVVVEATVQRAGHQLARSTSKIFKQPVPT